MEHLLTQQSNKMKFCTYRKVLIRLTKPICTSERSLLRCIKLALKITRNDKKLGKFYKTINILHISSKFSFDGDEDERSGRGSGGGRRAWAVAMCVYVSDVMTDSHMAYFLVHSRASSLYFSLSVL